MLKTQHCCPQPNGESPPPTHTPPPQGDRTTELPSFLNGLKLTQKTKEGSRPKGPRELPYLFHITPTYQVGWVTFVLY